MCRLMTLYIPGHVMHAARVHEPLRWVGESHQTKELFNLIPLVLTTRHLSGSAFAGLGLPEQAMEWMVSAYVWDW